MCKHKHASLHNSCSLYICWAIIDLPPFELMGKLTRAFFFLGTPTLHDVCYRISHVIMPIFKSWVMPTMSYVIPKGVKMTNLTHWENATIYILRYHETKCRMAWHLIGAICCPRPSIGMDNIKYLECYDYKYPNIAFWCANNSNHICIPVVMFLRMLLPTSIGFHCDSRTQI